LEQAGLCPKCSRNYEEALRALASERANAAAAEIELGRRMILACGLTLLVLQLAIAAVSCLVLEAGGLMLEVGRIVFLGGAIVGLYNGLRWARRWLQFATLFAALVSLRMTAIGSQNGVPLFVYLGVLLLVGYCAVFSYITFSGKVSRYLDSWPSSGAQIHT